MQKDEKYKSPFIKISINTDNLNTRAAQGFTYQLATKHLLVKTAILVYHNTYICLSDLVETTCICIK